MDVEIPKKGSGAHGSVVKKDIALALLRAVFPDESEEEVNRMLEAIGVQTDAQEQTLLPEETNEDILKMISVLDPTEQQSFEPLIKEALDKLETAVMKERAATRLKQKLESAGGEKAMTLDPPHGKAGAASGSRVFHGRNQAPPEFTKFLPDIPSLYIHWETKANRVYAEFKKLAGYQRTKSKSFDQNKSFASKLSALDLIFEYINEVYHLKFAGAANYNADWKRLLRRIEVSVSSGIWGHLRAFEGIWVLFS